jgi:type I restriction enzyme R subunit
VTTCLHGSIPAAGLVEIARYREGLARQQKPAEKMATEWASIQWKLAFVQVERWLDGQSANRVLQDPRLAQAVVDSLYFFAGRRYDLLAYVVMPSHMHWLFQPLPEWVEGLKVGRPTPRERIMYSLKRYTANACNRLQNKRGAFWQDESYDHWVRDSDEMERIIHYIEWNAVKAGLVLAPEEWSFSSAAARKVAGTAVGVPLGKPPSGSES